MTDLHLSCRSGPLGGDEPRNSVQFWLTVPFTISTSKELLQESKLAESFHHPSFVYPYYKSETRETTNTEALSKKHKNKAKYQLSPLTTHNLIDRILGEVPGNLVTDLLHKLQEGRKLDSSILEIFSYLKL